MKIEVLKENENKPLARKEIEFKVLHSGGATPSRADVRAKIVAQYDADEARVVVRSLTTKFGCDHSEGIARIYDSEEQMKRVERKHILTRHEEKKAEGT